jgi:hypothetical protein
MLQVKKKDNEAAVTKNNIWRCSQLTWWNSAETKHFRMEGNCDINTDTDTQKFGGCNTLILHLTPKNLSQCGKVSAPRF